MLFLLGLILALVSAVAVNFAYTLEHDAAEELPRLSPKRPFRSVRLLTHSGPWLRGFALETAGWLTYVAALRLAPLALVQAVSAAGIAVLALVGVQGHPMRLPRQRQLAVVVGLAGLTLIALSLVGHSHANEGSPHVIAAVVWLAGCAGGAFVLTAARTRIARAASLGLAAGLLFAGGDISVKITVHGGWWIVACAPLVAFYAVGSVRLQSAFQRGDALTAAGVATLATNAVPIAAGFALFGEALPAGGRAVMQIAGFVAAVLSGIGLAEAR